MSLKRISTPDGDVYFVDSKTGQRVFTNMDVIHPKKDGVKNIPAVSNQGDGKYGTVHVGCGQLVTYYDLIFTQNGIAFARTGRCGFWAVMFGIVGMLIAIRLRNKMQMELYDMPVEKILGLSEHNYFVPYPEVKSIRMKKIFGGKKLEIETSSGTKTFKLFGQKIAVPTKEEIAGYENIIKSIVPDKFIELN